MLIADEKVLGLVADSGGSTAGCCFLHNYGSTAGIGPVAVAPQHQARGIGRALVSAALERSGCPGRVRLTQDAANVASLALYTSLGFRVKEPLLLVEGLITGRIPTHTEVRVIGRGDRDETAALCERIYGFGERLNLESGFVVLREGRITGYSPGVSIHGFGVADSQEDLQALLAGTSVSRRKLVSFLLPLRLGGLVSWCMAEGLRLIRPMTLMSTETDRGPAGCYFPSLIG